MWESASAISEPQLLDVNDRRNPRGGASFRFSVEPGGYNPEQLLSPESPSPSTAGNPVPDAIHVVTNSHAHRNVGPSAGLHTPRSVPGRRKERWRCLGRDCWSLRPR